MCVSICKRVCMCECRHVLCMHISMCACECVHVSICKCICMCVHACECMHEYVCMCSCVPFSPAELLSTSRRNFETKAKMQIRFCSCVRNLNKTCSTFREESERPESSEQRTRQPFLNPEPTAAPSNSPDCSWVLLLETKSSQSR